MKETLMKLWSEYFAEECMVISTEEERALAEKAIAMDRAANELLTKSQSEFVEKYIELLCDIQDSFVKKAFLKGCEFTMSFVFEAGGIGKESSF